METLPLEGEARAGRPIDPEAELVAKAARGDGDAFAALVAPYQKRLYNLAYRLTGQQEEAADLVQEALLRAYASLGRFRAQAAFGTWLYRIAANVCLDTLRRQKRRPESPFASPVGWRGEESEDPAAIWERQQLIQKAIAELPPELRLPLILRDIQGFSYGEIAAIARISLDNVKTRLHRARSLLRQRFRELDLIPSGEGRNP